MSHILAITAPIYLLIALGYALVRGGVFSQPEMRVLGRLVAQLCLPALIFHALSQRRLAEVLHLDFLAVYAAGSLLLLAAGRLYAHWRGHGAALGSLIGLGMCASNSGFIGYPVMLQLVGPPAAVALALCMLVENLLILPLALALADREGRAGQPWSAAVVQSLRGLARQPLIWAIVAGFVCALAELQLPGPAARAVQLLAAASSPLALIAIGGALVGLRLQGLRLDLGAVVVGKLLLHPLAVAGLAALLLPASDALLRTAALVMPAMPMLSIYPVLAQKHHHEGFCAAALLAATVTSFFTLSLLLAFVTGPGGAT